jgi:hypothetical protein
MGECEIVESPASKLSRRTVLMARVCNRKEKMFMVLRSIEKNQHAGSLPRIQMEPLNVNHPPSKLQWRQRPLQKLQVQPTHFVKDVDLRPYLAVTRASEQLAEVLATSTDGTVRHLLWSCRRDDVLQAIPPAAHWRDMVEMMLLGTFNTDRASRRDLDQTMPLRERFRTTDLFREVLYQRNGYKDLTTGRGLGSILYFFLTGQSSSTARFTRAVGFPTTPEDIMDILTVWDTDKDGPIENMTLYGTANALFSFVVGTKTDMHVDGHRSRIALRLAYYYSEWLQQEWLTLLGDAAHSDISANHHPRVPFDHFLSFWRRLYVVYGIWGLGSGLLPLQITNTLFEVGLAECATLQTVADFVGQVPRLGAAQALNELGFAIDPKNPSSAALAFEVTYLHVQQLLDSATSLRFLPTDHEHRLCKTVRTYKLLREAFRDITHSRLLAWADQWLSGSDRQPIDLELVTNCIAEISSQ